MTVIPLKPRPGTGPVALAPEPSGHVILPASSRNAMTALEARVNDLRRIFAGPSTPVAQAARIREITLAIRAEAERVARFSR